MKINKIKGKIILTSSIYSVVAQDPNLYESANIWEYCVFNSQIQYFKFCQNALFSKTYSTNYKFCKS